MDILEILKGRRSIRKYKSEQIKESELEKILEAGMYAPSGMGRQSARMIVVQNPELRERLRRCNANIMNNENIDPFYGAPTVIVVVADKTIPTYHDDGVLVASNLMNEAYSIGIGSCYIYRAKEELEIEEGKNLRDELGIKETEEGIANIILGYPDEQPEAKPRKEDYIVRK